MGIRFKDSGGTLRTLVRMKVQDSGGVVRLIQRVRVMDSGGTLRTVFSFFTATLAPATLNGTYNGALTTPQNINCGNCIVTVAGGTSPYTYLWAQVGSSPYTWVIGGGTTATAGFTAQSIPLGVTTSVGFRCTVTDNLGNIVVTGDVTATAFNNSTG